MTKDTYQAEVIDPGDRASALAKEICFASHKNCPAVRIIPHKSGNFRGPVSYLWNRPILQMMASTEDDNDWSVVESVENDGAGGKPQFFTLANDPAVFRGLGWEIIAMCADDFARSGRFPAIMVNEIQTKGVNDKNWPLVEATLSGYGKALRQSGLVNITGEFAIMKHSITAFCSSFWKDQFILTWSGTCIGLARRQFLIDGSAIAPNMPIVGFWEPGYRCNGGTFFTNVIKANWSGNSSAITNIPEVIAFAKRLAIPSQSYARLICQLVGWGDDGTIGISLAEIAGIAHITGGGVWGKLGDILPEGVGANLNNMPPPAPVLLEGQEMSLDTKFELSDHQAYGTLHGGCGMLVIAKTTSDARTIIEKASEYGVSASVVGHTIASSENEIRILSRFRSGNWLSSLDK